MQRAWNGVLLMCRLITGKSSFVFLAVFCLFPAGSLRAHAQVEPSARRREFTVNAGVMGSVFQPDYGSHGLLGTGTAPHPLLGPGAYVDFGTGRWFRFEAEGRWLRFNQYQDVYQDSYLIGPRIPLLTRRGRRLVPYGKALVGWTSINLVENSGNGRFTTLALGGGTDLRASRRLSIRLFDLEYQIWPNWPTGAVYDNTRVIKPYGASVGFAYRVF